MIPCTLATQHAKFLLSAKGPDETRPWSLYAHVSEVVGVATLCVSDGHRLHLVRVPHVPTNERLGIRLDVLATLVKTAKHDSVVVLPLDPLPDNVKDVPAFAAVVPAATRGCATLNAHSDELERFVSMGEVTSKEGKGKTAKVKHDVLFSLRAVPCAIGVWVRGVGDALAPLDGTDRIDMKGNIAGSDPATLEDKVVRFNPRYIADAISFHNGTPEDVQLRYAPLEPMVVTASDRDNPCTAVVMPIAE